MGLNSTPCFVLISTFYVSVLILFFLNLLSLVVLNQWSSLVLVAAVCPAAGPSLSDHCPVPDLAQRPPGTPPPRPRVLLSELDSAAQRFYMRTDKWSETIECTHITEFWDFFFFFWLLWIIEGLLWNHSSRPNHLVEKWKGCCLTKQSSCAGVVFLLFEFAYVFFLTPSSSLGIQVLRVVSEHTLYLIAGLTKDVSYLWSSKGS